MAISRVIARNVQLKHIFAGNRCEFLKYAISMTKLLFGPTIESIEYNTKLSCD